jgi:hypothetical protein
MQASPSLVSICECADRLEHWGDRTSGVCVCVRKRQRERMCVCVKAFVC